jgi:hypothetical protein
MKRVISVGALLAALGLLASVASAGAREGAAKPGRFRVAYMTFLGGKEWDQPREIIVYPDGSVLVGGQTVSPDLAVTDGAVQPRYAGEPAGSGHGGVVMGDCFLARLDPEGRRILAMTYFGGSRQERAVYGMALDRAGNIVITSACRSRDLATTKGSYQPKYGGGVADVMVAKITPDMKEAIWCTYVGGRGNDWPRGGLALDADGNVIIVGRSDSADFPGTPGVLRARPVGAKGDAMVAKLKADGSGLVWATLVGGSDWDGLMGARSDEAGNVYVAGHTRSKDLPVTAGAPQRALGGKSDCWLACLTPDGRRLRYCTYLGGGENEFAEHRPYLLADGSVLVTGVTASADFPATAGAVQTELKGKTDGFIAKLSPEGKKFEFATLLGGSGGDFFLTPTPDARGNIHVVGRTQSKDFPVTPDAVQKTFGGGGTDGVYAVISPDGKRLVYATYVGGSGEDLLRSVALGADGAVYLLGNSTSDDLPITPGVVQPKRKGGNDGLVVKLAPHEPRSVQ